MLENNTRVADLTVTELLELIRRALREELQHEYQPINQMALLELQPLHVGQWPKGLKLLSREEFYDGHQSTF
jgi:hypothetical protein